MTEEITVEENGEAILKGGHIDAITSMQNTVIGWDGQGKPIYDPHIDLYCRPGWSWLSDDPLLGIAGLWEDSTPFSIEFVNDDLFGYEPVWTNINVIEIPESASCFLLALGGLAVKLKIKK